MTEAMSRPPAADTSDGLYFKIVCDPGHERTTRELRQLPRESRERVWADMTGDLGTAQQVSDPEEDHQFVQECLMKMNNDLQLLTTDENRQALQSQMAYDPMFRLMFLRAEDFDPSQAAHRMVRHFEQKKNLFGTDKLERDIRLSDLSSDDMDSLACGALQFLPRTDRGGRIVFVSRYRNFVYKEKENLVRFIFDWCAYYDSSS